jgi:hypothetical protein
MKIASKYIIKVDYAVSMKKDNGAENKKELLKNLNLKKLIEKFSEYLLIIYQKTTPIKESIYTNWKP